MIRPGAQTAFALFQLRRGDDSRESLDWHQVGVHVTHTTSAGVALTEWLLENDPAPGRYRCDGPGDSATGTHGPESLCA